MNEITLSEYALMTGISAETLTNGRRTKALCAARQVHWLYLHSIGYSYERIGLLYGRHYTTILSGVNNIIDLIETRDSLIAPHKEFVKSFFRSSHS